MSKELIAYQPKNDSIIESLTPLKFGNPVSFKVTDPSMRKKKRIKIPVLFIIPAVGLNLGTDSLIVAMEGYGCEVIPKYDIKPMSLYRVGLSMKASKILAKELNKIFNTMRTE